MIGSVNHRAKWLGLPALLAGLAIVLASCQSSTSSSPSEQASEPAASEPAASEPAGEPTVEEIIANAGITDDDSFCGTEPMTLGVLDGLGENAWSAASYAAVVSEAAKCPNVTVDVKSGNYDPVQASAIISNWIGQVDAITVIPDAGPMLPAIQEANEAGVIMVPWASDPLGVAGTDFLEYVDWDTFDAGVKWANWMVEALNGEGNVVFLGGFAGSQVGVQQLNGINSVFDDEPGITLLTGRDNFVATDWNPAMAQEAMVTLLRQHADIDGVISNYGSDLVGIIRAFEGEGRALVPMTSLEANQLGCEFDALKADNPNYELTTISSRNWLGRIAARKAIAAFQGIENNEPTLYPLTLFEDTLAGLAPKCDSNQGPDVYLSNQLTAAELEEFGKVTD